MAPRQVQGASIVKQSCSRQLIAQPGELEPNYDASIWSNYDEESLEFIDTDENRADIPEGFEWTCCGKVGYEEECKTGEY